MKKTYVALILSVLAAARCYSQVNVYDGFETPELSKIWATDRMMAGSVQMQPAVVRNGHSAAKISLKAGDMFEAGKNGDHDSERDELREANNLVSGENIPYEYKFSLFLP